MGQAERARRQIAVDGALPAPSIRRCNDCDAFHSSIRSGARWSRIMKQYRNMKQHRIMK
jgi:hypothetical protein